MKWTRRKSSSTSSRQRRLRPDAAALRVTGSITRRGMAMLFGLVLVGCIYVVCMHHLAGRVPRSGEVLAGVKVVHATVAGPDRTLVQVERSQVERTASPLREALADQPSVSIGPCRFDRVRRGLYRFRGWAASAELQLTATADARILQVAYSVDTRW
ncbi:MAG: hypothetical protein PHU85_15930 [Phycisphaerae bacterium]|nr:hypothetical protein [Phycisphaerae bacterium]